jgi:chromosome segregation ATPase
MKKLIAFCCIVASLATFTQPSRAEADPAKDYTEAFLAMREAERAEANSEFAKAQAKYKFALELLTTIRKDNPTWNTTMVEHRFNDCTTKLQAVSEKVPAQPEPSPAPAPEPTPAPTPQPETTPAPSPAPGTALTAEFKAPDATNQLRADLARTNAEITRLKAQQTDLQNQLAAARTAAETTGTTPRIERLTTENKNLLQQLANNNKLIEDLRAKLATAEAKSTKSAELNKLRSQLADAAAKTQRLETSQTELENRLADQAKQLAEAKEAAARTAQLQKDNEKLTAQLASLNKQVQDLQAQLNAKTDGKAEIATLNEKLASLEKQNTDLRTQLDTAEKKAAQPPKVETKVETKTVISSDTDELNKLRAQLETAQAELARTTKNTQTLQKENTGLEAQLADANNEINRLKTQSDKSTGRGTQNFGPAPRSSSDTAIKSLNQEIAKLEKQNADLRTQLNAAKKAPKPASVKNNDAELKDLRDQLAKTRAQLAEAQRPNPYLQNLQKQNSELNDRINDANNQIAQLKKQLQAKQPPAPATESAELKSLRAELATAKAELQTAQQKAAAAPTVQTKTIVSSDTAELTKLRADLAAAQAEAKQAKASQTRITELQHENENLTAQLATTGNRGYIQSARPAGSAEVADLKKQNAALRAEVEKVKTTGNKEVQELKSRLEKQNSDLRAELAAAQKATKVETKTVIKTDTEELNKLRAQLASAQAETDKAKATGTRAEELSKANLDLSDQLSTTQKQITDLQQQLAAKNAEPPKTIVKTDIEELNKLRAELAATRDEIARTKSLAGQVATLEAQNKELSTKLQATRRPAIVTGVTAEQSTELAQLRSEIAAMRAETTRAKQSTQLIEKLAQENTALKSQLAATTSQPPAGAIIVQPAPATAPAAALSPEQEAAILKKLRQENSYLLNVLKEYSQENPELKARLRKLQQQSSGK